MMDNVPQPATAANPDGMYPNPFEHEWEHCPHCGHDSTEGSSMSIEGTLAYQLMTCNRCSNSWTEQYIRYTRTL